MLLFLLKFAFTLYLSSVHSVKLNEEIFYKADTLVYTPEFCSNLTAFDFLHSIRPNDSEHATSYDAQKAKAFKTLFDACRDRLLYDATMTKNVIVPMVDTGNTEYLPLLLDRGMIKRPKHVHTHTKDKKNATQMEEVYNNLDLTPEIKSIILHLFGVNISPTPKTIQYFFQVRHPDRALAYLLAYGQLEGKESLEEVRDLLENIKGHVAVGEYTDAKCIERACKLVDGYLKSPKTVGNHKFNLPVLTKESEDFDETVEASSFSIGFILLALATISGIIYVLYKPKNNNAAYQPAS